MEKYLYQDLYEKEKKHFWHISKRQIALMLLQKYLPKRKNLKILDIGCGTGENINALNSLGETFGIDNSVEAVSFCKKNGLKNVSIGLAEKTKFKSESFDVVTLFDLLEHVDDKKAVVEFKRILKREGFVLITVPAHNRLWSRWDEVLHHKRRYKERDLKKLLVGEGFTIIKSSYMYSYLLLPMLIIRFVKNIFYKDHYPSDFEISSSLVNTIGVRLSKIERFFINSLRVPIGTSIICLAKKSSY